ncbi:hypothetical protein THRCLA_07945 [Thraustotheca clavata]|uniref:Tubulin--tyrosine ligase-like protein 5 n=1 Tax=Thraustotheca clavata TaxID=74557 RepID=A0A1V9ZBG5_9STRA|nr:hypothetical protein THRCLA_07945 [Thraustotheca clavata]
MRFVYLAVAVFALDDRSSRQTKVFLLPEKARHHLQPLLDAFNGMGVQEMHGPDALTWKAAKKTQEFDLVWSYEYSQFQHLGPLERRHRINHLPGSYVLVSKGHVYETLLELQGIHGKYDFNFIPKQFRLPQDVDEFSAAFRERKNRAQETKADDDPDYNKRWLLKQQSHRGVQFFSGLDQLGDHMHSNDMIAQCIEPLLISGHKFDIGLYVAVTSIDPLRIYIYHNALLRMCKLKYPKHLDNTADLESYVVDDYLPPWEMPDLQEFYTEIPSEEIEGTSHFKVLKQYLESVGIDPEKFQSEIYGDVVKIIAGNREHFMDSEQAVRRQTKQPHEQLGNFFEMYRFDFMVEDTGKPWLMEVNQSPNLAPKYFNSGTDFTMKSSLIHDLLHMVSITAPGELSVYLPQLNAAECNDRCSDVKQVWEMPCWRCPGWFTENEGNTLLEGATEYARRGKYNLVYPTVDKQYSRFVSGGLTAHDEAFERYLASFEVYPAADRKLSHHEPLLCGNREHCSRHGDCVNGACVCDIGYEGKTCYIPTGKKREKVDKPKPAFKVDDTNLQPANLRQVDGQEKVQPQIAAYFMLGASILLVAVYLHSRAAKVFLLPETFRHHLSPLLRAFRELGIQEYYGEDAMSWKAAKKTQDFDLVWSWEYSKHQQLGLLERRHKVNHLPGSYVLVSKSHIYETQLQLQSIHGEEDFNFIPKQYLLPKEAEEFKVAFEERKNQVQAVKCDDPDYNRRWLLKQQSHRGVQFFSGLDEIDAHMNSNDMIAQCIEPLLISGHKFDIGLYVAIMSIDPLRIYIYHNSVVRICKLQYPNHLDDTADLESYVVDDFIPPWAMPDLQEFYPEIPNEQKQDISNFQVIKKYLAKVGIDPEKFQREIYGAVVKIIAGNREHFVNSEKTLRHQTK